ncbi:MAG: sulfite exporter TauE/SafE family protein [Gammaproteobacteria bacterium]|jgi:uncharacterized membrane protein YfcA|nr:sulfite exporter TauE/SafE family protein [Gammaproteobacteria bacterium]MBQ0774982.1 sulfite exporter TauE/SafE family protein [Gammaproteobacteria bacterium]
MRRLEAALCLYVDVNASIANGCSGGVVIIELFVLSAAAGILAGLLSGTLGLGGGVVVVPALLYIFHVLGFAEETLTQQAVATSLATIIITSISSVTAHYRRGALRKDLIAPLAAGVVAGAFAGALLASHIDGQLLKRLFGGLALVVALQSLLSSMRAPQDDEAERLPAPRWRVVAGVGVGAVSAMFGIGGGSMTVPLLTFWRVRMQQAVAASAACGVPIALAGCAGFIVGGWRLPLPPGSVGFIYLPAVAGIVVTSFPLAWVGARIAHRLPGTILKRIFALVLLILGLKLALG